MVDDTQNNKSFSGRISRRDALKIGAASLLAGVSGHEPKDTPRDDSPLPSLGTPKTAQGDIKKRFEEAEKELDNAISKACADVKEAEKRYGLLDISKVQDGAVVRIVPAHAREKTSVQYWLRADANKKHSMPGLAEVIDACIKIEHLYDEMYHQDVTKKPELMDYGKVAEKMLLRYQQINPKDKMQPADQRSMEVLIKNYLKSNMDNVMVYERRERTAQEQEAANARFMELFHTHKDDGMVFVDPFSPRLENSLSVIFISDDEKKKQGGGVMVNDRIRSQFGVQVPVPDRDTFQKAANELPRTYAMQMLLSGVFNHYIDKDRKTQDHGMALTMAGPLGIGSMHVGIQTETLNPNLHQNRVQGAPLAPIHIPR